MVTTYQILYKNSIFIQFKDLPKLSENIITFAASFNRYHILDIDCYNSSFHSSLANINNSLINLHKQLMFNPINCISAVSTPNLITSLIKLTQFNQYFRNNMKQDNQSLNFIFFCRDCLNTIQNNGGIIAQQQLLNDGYIKALSESISLCGGYSHESQITIQKIISYITGFIYNIYNENSRNYSNQEQSNDQQVNLSIEFEEQIEEEGGVEEIQVRFINNKVDISPKFNAIYALKTLFNSYQNSLHIMHQF